MVCANSTIVSLRSVINVTTLSALALCLLTACGERSTEPGLGAANGSSGGGVGGYEIFNSEQPPLYHPLQPSAQGSYSYGGGYSGSGGAPVARATGAWALAADPSSVTAPQSRKLGGPSTPPIPGENVNLGMSGWWNMSEDVGTMTEKIIYGKFTRSGEQTINSEEYATFDVYQYHYQASYEGDGRNCFLPYKTLDGVYLHEVSIGGVEYQQHGHLLRSTWNVMHLISNNHIYRYLDGGRSTSWGFEDYFYEFIYTRLINVTSTSDFPHCDD